MKFTLADGPVNAEPSFALQPNDLHSIRNTSTCSTTVAHQGSPSLPLPVCSLSCYSPILWDGTERHLALSSRTSSGNMSAPLQAGVGVMCNRWGGDLSFYYLHFNGPHTTSSRQVAHVWQWQRMGTRIVRITFGFRLLACSSGTQGQLLVFLAHGRPFY